VIIFRHASIGQPVSFVSPLQQTVLVHKPAYYTQRACGITAPRTLPYPQKTQQVKKQASSFVPFELIRCNFDESRSHTQYHHQIPDTIQRRTYHIPSTTPPSSLYCLYCSRAIPHGTGRLFAYSLLARSFKRYPFFPCASQLPFSISFRFQGAVSLISNVIDAC
jgi:hypothetical protein